MPALKLAEVVVRQLTSDPSVIARFRKRLPDDDYEAGAIALTRSRRVEALVRQGLGMPVSPAKPRRNKIPGPPPSQRPGSRKPRDQTYVEFRRRAMKQALKQQPINACIAHVIETALAAARAGIRDGKLVVYGYDRERGRRVKLSDADLVGQPAPPAAMWNRLGRFEDVTFEYIDGADLQQEPESILRQDEPRETALPPRGHKAADELLMPEMSRLIADGLRPYAAGLKLAPEAAGVNSSDESKAKRLSRRFSEFQNRQR